MAFKTKYEESLRDHVGECIARLNFAIDCGLFAMIALLYEAIENAMILLSVLSDESAVLDLIDRGL